MDTRQKIVGVERARSLAFESGHDMRIVSGYFDPLLASHAEALARVRRDAASLMIVVRTPADPLLSLRARAELAAALCAVDWVVPLDQDSFPEWVGALPAGRLIRFERDDEERRAEFLRHIHERHLPA